MKDYKNSARTMMIIALAIAIFIILALLLISANNDGTNQNVQPDTRDQQTESGTDSGDGPIDEVTPNSEQTQVQDSEGSTVPQN